MFVAEVWRNTRGEVTRAFGNGNSSPAAERPEGRHSKMFELSDWAWKVSEAQYQSIQGAWFESCSAGCDALLPSKGCSAIRSALGIRFRAGPGFKKAKAERDGD
jgi:hypothetical protein